MVRAKRASYVASRSPRAFDAGRLALAPDTWGWLVLVVVAAVTAVIWGAGKAGPVHWPMTQAPENAVRVVNARKSALEPPKLATAPGFSWLLHPVSVAEFVAQHWERQPLHIQRPPAYYDGLQSGLYVMEALLLTQAAVHGDAELLHPNTHKSQADCTWVRHGMLDRRPDYPTIYHAYLDGCTAVCNIVPAYWPPLAELMTQLEETAGFPFMANLYLSPRGSQGFVAHTDNKDGFLLQMAGAKRWVVHASTFPRPMRLQTVGRPWQPPASTVRGPLLYDAIVMPGDLLHLPRGVVHYAEALGDAPSLHFTVSSAKNLEWPDVLTPYIAQLHQTMPPAQPVLTALQSRLSELILDPGASWLRAALPFNRSGDATAVCLQLAALLPQLQSQLAGPALAGWRELRTSVANGCNLLATVMLQHTIYPEYIHRLHRDAAQSWSWWYLGCQKLLAVVTLYTASCRAVLSVSAR